MTAESKQAFEAKRRNAEILNLLYYVTVFPFLLHNLGKFFYYLFSKSSLLKSSDRYQVEEPLEKFGIEDSANSTGKDKKVLKKTPIAGETGDEKKFNVRWRVKSQPSKHTIQEIIVGNVFQLLLGKECAAKVRLMKDEKTGEIYTLSKLFDKVELAYDRIEKEFFEGRVMRNRTDCYDKHLKETENLDSYEKMLVVSLITGRYDVHSANWGILKQENSERAVTFDYGAAIEKPGLNLIPLLQTYRYPFERIVCDKFLLACEKIIEKFEQNYDAIEQAVLQGIETAERGFLPWWKVPTVNYVMRVFAANKRELEHLCYWIRAEMAVSQNNSDDFKGNLNKVDKSYCFPVLSTQRRDFYLRPYAATSNNSLIHDNTFKTLINEGYSRVFMCNKLPNPKFREKNQNALFLIAPKEEGQTLMFCRGGEFTHSPLNEKQLDEIQKLAQVPDRGRTELSADVSKKIIAICHCPHEKPSDVRGQLNQIYQAYLSPSV